MDVTTKEMPSSFNHSAIAELTASLKQEDGSSVCVDGGVMSQMPGDDAVMNCISIKKELTDEAAKNGISHCLSSDHFKGSRQYALPQAVMSNLRTLGFCGSVSQSQLNTPNVCGPPTLQSKDCTARSKLSHVSGVQVLPVSVSRDVEDLKENCGDDGSSNHTDFLNSSIISSEILGDCSSITAAVPSVVEPMLNYTENLFDASIISPISSFVSGIAVPGSEDSIVSVRYQPLTLENHDVCESVMMTEVLKMGKNVDSLTSLQTLTSSLSNGLVNCSVFNLTEQCGSSVGDNVKSELLSKSQGLAGGHGMLAQMRIPNGISSIYSSKFNISQASLCANVDVSAASDNLLPRDQSCASICDPAMQGVSKNCSHDGDILEKNTFLTCDVSTSSMATDDDASVRTDLVDCSAVSLKMNVQLLDSFQHSTSEETLDMTSTEGISAELGEKSESGLDKMPTSKLKTPKARKSCSLRPKEPRRPLDASRASSDVCEAMDGRSVESQAAVADAVPARTTLSSMTIKLPELETVLGIGHRSLDKMDAKTLDRIVLAKAQKNARLEADLERSKAINLRGLVGRPHSNSISAKTRRDVSSNKADKEREAVQEDGDKAVRVTEEMTGRQCPKKSAGHRYGDELQSGSGTCDVKDASKENNFLSLKTAITCSTDCNESVMKSNHGSSKGLSEKRDDSSTQTKTIQNRKESGHMTASLPPPVTLANGMIFKARKSQGYAFGRVKCVRDVLNSPEAQLSLSLTNKAGANPAKSYHASQPRKQTVSPHPYAKPKFANSQSSAAISGNLSETERKPNEADINSLSHKRKQSKRQKLMSHSGESFLVSHGKSKSKREFALSFGKCNSLERASVSSSSSADNFSVKLPHKLADKISYPVTPPRSPEGCATHSADEMSSQMNSETNGYLKPSCCCRQSVAANLEDLAICQALESVDGKIVGCTRKWTNKKIVRPSTRIPFMAMCDKHVDLLSNHQCCPGCGQFCVQGEFYQCKQSSAVEVHTFHRHCQVFRGTSYSCPHCGAESVQESVVLQAVERYSTSLNDSKQFSKVPRNARIGGFSARIRRRDGSVCSASNSVSSITSRNSQPEEPNLLGINRKELEASLVSIVDLGKEKQKKVRLCAKSFYAACKNGELDRVIYMIDEGIDPNNRPDDYSESCLHIAVRHGQREVVKLLLQAGALPNSLDISLYTPIMVAAVSGRLPLLEVLVRAGGSLLYRTVDGMTVLHLAAKSGQLDVTHSLVENYQLDVNVKDDGGWTPVIWATEYKHSATVKYLLKMGANPNIQDKELNTGLHWAAYAGCYVIAEMFLNAGCDLDYANERGDQPLHIAARQDHYECVSFLLMRGADAGALNKANLTPAECCPEKSTSTRTVLLLNQRIKRSSATRPNRPERLVHYDVSLGREANPITVVNGIDKSGVPDDFTYVADYVETNAININRMITSLRVCNCTDGGSSKEECATINCNCIRSSIKCWYDKEGRLSEEFNYHDPPLIFECNRACRCHANCQNRVIQLGITCRLQVFRTRHRGWGCRSLLNIPKGSFVCEYFGELISDAEADRRQDDSYLFDLDNQDTDTFCVDAAKFGNVSRFINHRCEPNLTPVKVFVDHQDLRFPRMCFFANRDINTNEELGFDYGDKFWVIKYKDFTCDCGSPKCRYSVNTIGQTLEDFKRRQEEEAAHATRT